jgi:hypothetical protein
MPHAAPPGSPETGAYMPPVPQQGVNPLGGTVAADAGNFAAAAFAQQGGPPPYGAPPGQAPYGGPGQAGQYGVPQQQFGTPPPGASPQFGAPPQQFGTPPPGQPYGAPPNQYGAPQYGAPPQGAAPHPMAPGGLMPYGGAMPSPMAGTLPSSGATATGPKKRNALMTWLLPVLVMVGGIIAGAILAIAISPTLAIVSTLGVLVGGLWYLILTIQMATELKAVTGNPSFAWWPVLIPLYQYYWLLVLLPQEVARAKQMRGVQAPVRSLVLYFFLGNFALASDLNDLAR